MTALTGSRERSTLWLVKQFTGVLVFFLIITHVIINHMVSPDGLLSYDEVIQYLGNPWVAAMETLFLLAVIFHSILGVRSVLLDLNPSKRVLKAVDPLLLLLGIGAAVYGIWLTSIVIGRAG